MSIIAIVFATIAIFMQPTPPPAAFTQDVLHGCAPIVKPGDFIGCEGTLTSDDPSEVVYEDDMPYAGLIWVDGVPEWTTGP